MTAVAVVLVCDGCRTERRVGAATLTAARAVLHAAGWRRLRRNDRWVDVCVACMKTGTRWAA